MRNIFKYIVIVIVISIVSTGLFQYYQNFDQAKSYNNFLDNAGLISSLHYEASDEFKEILDFSEISREDFENKINRIVSNSKEAYEIIN